LSGKKISEADTFCRTWRRAVASECLGLLGSGRVLFDHGAGDRFAEARLTQEPKPVRLVIGSPPKHSSDDRENLRCYLSDQPDRRVCYCLAGRHRRAFPGPETAEKFGRCGTDSHVPVMKHDGQVEERPRPAPGVRVPGDRGAGTKPSSKPRAHTAGCPSSRSPPHRGWWFGITQKYALAVGFAPTPFPTSP